MNTWSLQYDFVFQVTYLELRDLIDHRLGQGLSVVSVVDHSRNFPLLLGLFRSLFGHRQFVGLGFGVSFKETKKFWMFILDLLMCFTFVGLGNHDGLFVSHHMGVVATVLQPENTHRQAKVEAVVHHVDVLIGAIDVVFPVTLQKLLLSGSCSSCKSSIVHTLNPRSTMLGLSFPSPLRLSREMAPSSKDLAEVTE